MLKKLSLVVFALFFSLSVTYAHCGKEQCHKHQNHHEKCDSNCNECKGNDCKGCQDGCKNCDGCKKGECKHCENCSKCKRHLKNTVKFGDLYISKAVMRSVPTDKVPTAAYLTIENKGSQDDALVRVFSDIAQKTEIHDSKIDEKGIMSMNMLEKILIPAGKKVSLAPKGKHIMLMKLDDALSKGQYIPLRLDFEKSGSKMIAFKVRDKMGTCHKGK